MPYKRVQLSLYLLLLTLLGFTPLALLAETASLEKQRALFLTAEKAIQRGDVSQLTYFKKGLKNYPLLPYLDYAHLTGTLSNLDKQYIENFIDLNADTPLANRLRYLWLKQLARQNKDAELIANFQPTTDTALECAYRSALLDKGLTPQALEGIENIWLNGRSQPDSCDPVFKAWKNTGALTSDLVWQRIELAMQDRNVKLADFLARDLPTEQRKFFRLWDKVIKQPALIDSAELFVANSATHRKILAHGVQRLAFRNIDHAIKSWQQLQANYVFNDEEKTRTSQILALLIGQNITMTPSLI